jgi:alpha-L-fucosidase 2
MARIPRHAHRRFARIALAAILVSAGIEALIGQPAQERPAQPMRLWYDRAATAFEEALPLGNGRTGAMVYGGPASDHVLLNDSTLWTGGPIDPAVNPEAINWLPRVREALFKGDYKTADSMTRRIQGKFSQSYAPLGDLYIDAAGITAAQVTGYRRELDLATAVARTTFTAGGTRFSRDAFVSYPDKLLVIRLSASTPGRLGFALRFGSQLRHQVTVADNGDLLLSGRAPVHAEPNYRRDVKVPLAYDEGANPKGTRFAARARLLQADGKAGRGPDTITLEGGTTAVIAVAIDTSFAGFDKEPSEGPDPILAALARLDAVAGRSFASLQAAHTKDVGALFRRVDLDLGRTPQAELPTDVRLRDYAAGAADPGLEALYFQFGRYLLISGSRPGSPALNLQGIWNPHMRPPWSSNYTVNINTEMNYWPAETANLAECHQPLLRFIGDLAKTGAVTARHFYGAGGWCVHHNSDIWALSNPVGDFGQGDPRWANWPMAGVWMSQHLWERYAFGGDAAWLRATAYPLMKGAAEFVMDWLVEGPDGFLVTAPSTSPENGYRTPDGYEGVVSVMTTSDLALIRGLFLNVIQAAETLDIDAGFRAAVKAKLDRLPPYKVGRRGNLQEWYLDWDDPEPEHRHVSHLIGLYPDDQISPIDTPALAAAVKRSLELRGDGGTGWAKAWKIGLWARLFDGNHAYRMLRTHLQYVPASGETQYKGGGTYPNLFDAHPPFQIDGNFGGTAGIAEMLLQSQRGEVHLLPALPSGWATGSVRGLRARGGFTVDIRWRDDTLQSAHIKADRAGTLRVRYGQSTADHAVSGGQSVTVTAGPPGLILK